MKAKNLKLIANTFEDIGVISAHLQDAIVSSEDIAHLIKSRIFLKKHDRYARNFQEYS